MQKVLSSISSALFPLAQGEAAKAGASVASFSRTSEDIGVGRKKLVFTLEIQADADDADQAQAQASVPSVPSVPSLLLQHGGPSRGGVPAARRGVPASAIRSARPGGALHGGRTPLRADGNEPLKASEARPDGWSNSRSRAHPRGGSGALSGAGAAYAEVEDIDFSSSPAAQDSAAVFLAQAAAAESASASASAARTSGTKRSLSQLFEPAYGTMRVVFDEERRAPGSASSRRSRKPGKLRDTASGPTASTAHIVLAPTPLEERESFVPLFLVQGDVEGQEVEPSDPLVTLRCRAGVTAPTLALAPLDDFYAEVGMEAPPPPAALPPLSARCSNEARWWGFCDEHCAQLPLTKAHSVEWMRDAISFFVLFAKRAGADVWLSGRSAIGAWHYGAPDPTSWKGALTVADDDDCAGRRVYHALEAMVGPAALRGYEIHMLAGPAAGLTTPLATEDGGTTTIARIAPPRRLTPEGGWVSPTPFVEIKVALRVPPLRAAAWCGNDTGLFCVAQDLSCLDDAFPGWRHAALFDPLPLEEDDGPRPLPFAVCSESESASASVLLEGSDPFFLSVVRKPLFLSSKASTDLVSWLVPAAAMRRSYYGTREMPLLAVLSDVATTPAFRIDMIPTPGAADGARFVERIVPALALLTPGTIRPTLMYRDAPRILVTLREAGSEALAAFAFVKIFRVSAADKASASQSASASVQRVRSGGAKGLAALAALSLSSPGDSITVLYVDALCSAADRPGTGKALLSALFSRVLPYLDAGTVWGVLEPLQGLAESYASMGLGLEPLVCDTYVSYMGLRYAAAETAALRAGIEPAFPALRIALTPASEPKTSHDMAKEQIFSPLNSSFETYHKELHALNSSFAHPKTALEKAIPIIAKAVAAHVGVFTALALSPDFYRGIAGAPVRVVGSAPLGGGSVAALAVIPSAGRVRAMLLRQTEIVRRSFGDRASLLLPAKQDVLHSPFFTLLEQAYGEASSSALDTATNALTTAETQRKRIATNHSNALQ